MVIFKMETESSTMSMGKEPSTVATVGLGSFGEAITSVQWSFLRNRGGSNEWGG